MIENNYNKGFNKRYDLGEYMPDKSEKTRGWIKDAIYIFLFICAVVGYFVDKSYSNATESATVKQNTQAIQGLTKTMDDFNKNMIEDAEFKGKVLQYMESTDKDIDYIKERLP